MSVLTKKLENTPSGPDDSDPPEPDDKSAPSKSQPNGKTQPTIEIEAATRSLSYGCEVSATVSLTAK